MTKWSGQKVDSNKINNGNEYERIDKPTRQQLNAIVNNSLYASQISENVANQLSNLKPNEKIEFKGSNPNLLINGDFRINQRGLPSYSVDGYTVDRWRTSTSNLTVNVVPTGISLKGGTRVRYLYQQIENIKDLLGKTVTFSINIKGIAGMTGKINLYDKTTETALDAYSFEYTGSYQIESYTATIPINFQSLCVLIYMNNSNTQTDDEVFVDWAKLEIGSVATSFSPRPYAEELSMCQRYYMKYIANGNRSVFMNGILNSKSECYFTIDRTFRTDPTVTMNGSFIFYGASYKTITSMSCIKDYNTSNSITIWCAFAEDSSLTINVPVRLRADSDNSSLELDAEM